MTTTAAILTMILPFAAFAVIMVLTRSYKRISAGISIAAIAVALICSVYLLIGHWHLDAPVVRAATWMSSGVVMVPIGFLLDQTSLLMLVVVTVICFLVQIFSLGYMAGDPGFSRYYGFMSLFAWAMISLTVAPTLLQLYIFWELVGLSSYLLIGFWYEKFSASEAGKKAFVMTRTGDVALLLGILLLLAQFGNLEILSLNSGEIARRMSGGSIALAALLIFGGIIGKSAQFPLLTWLPDAMEGPTPVSALLHSATMVAAGVYLFARLFPFFTLSPAAMTVFLSIGTISMLLAATMAMVARDIKQVWAFSTISQLGLMIMGLAAGGFFPGMFHLTTHAGFKALLFLCAGVFIHHFETNDMFEIGQKGGRRLKIPMICMIVGAAALSGLPPFSGFFSKELILARLSLIGNPLWVVAGLIGAFLTSYYAFRLIFIMLFPKNGDQTGSGSGGDAHHRRHATDWTMAGPLVVLAFFTLVLGLAEEMLSEFLSPHVAEAAHAAIGHFGRWLPITGISLAAVGVLLAFVEFGLGKDQIGFVERVPKLSRLFAERWYLDLFWRKFLDRFVYGTLSRYCTLNDKKVIDGGVDGLADATVSGGDVVSRWHYGMIQFKLVVIFAALAMLCLYVVFGIF